MDLGIRGKTALVCAASKGLGKGCAASLAREGVNLVITARGKEALERMNWAHGHFKIANDDFLYVLQEEPPAELRAKCEEAARVCPKQAITIEDN